MPLKLMRDCTNYLARRAGYVPAAEMEQALAERDKIQEELLLKTRNLQSQILLRDRMEQEVNFLRELQLAHARNESGTQQAVEKLDNITKNLVAMMQSVWPEAYSLEPSQEATEEVAEAA